MSSRRFVWSQRHWQNGIVLEMLAHLRICQRSHGARWVVLVEGKLGNCQMWLHSTEWYCALGRTVHRTFAVNEFRIIAIKAKADWFRNIAILGKKFQQSKQNLTLGATEHCFLAGVDSSESIRAYLQFTLPASSTHPYIGAGLHCAQGGGGNCTGWGTLHSKATLNEELYGVFHKKRSFLQ